MAYAKVKRARNLNDVQINKMTLYNNSIKSQTIEYQLLEYDSTEGQLQIKLRSPKASSTLLTEGQNLFSFTKSSG